VKNLEMIKWEWILSPTHFVASLPGLEGLRERSFDIYGFYGFGHQHSATMKLVDNLTRF